MPTARRHVHSRYFQLSRSPHYSFVFAIPLLIAYEGFALLLNHSDLYGIRNSADVFLKLFLAYVGIHGFFGLGAAMLGGLILLRVFGGGAHLAPMRVTVLGWMLAESLAYSLAFAVLVRAIPRLALAYPLTLSRSAQILVSLGAGIYEELIFRVLLLMGLVFLLHRLLRLQPGAAYAVAAGLGAFLFAVFHYVGPFGDVLELPSFVFRFTAGLVLTGLYWTRGYGITAYTHSLYDLWITLGVV